MRPRKFIAMVMTFLMVLSLLPSLVFAAAVPEGELGGKLKFKGIAAVGSELSADYSKVTPEGLTDEYVSFTWSRKDGDKLTEIGKEKTYKLTDEDLGYKIELKITGLSEMGITGELKANTVEIVATPEEAPEETTEEPEETDAENPDAEAAEATDEAEKAASGDSEEDVIDIGADPSYDSSQSSEQEQSVEDIAGTDNSEIQDNSTDPGYTEDTAENTGDTNNDSADTGYDAPAGTENSVSDNNDSISTDDSVIDIGTEDYLEVPTDGAADNTENGNSAEAPAEDPSQETPSQPQEEVTYSASVEYVTADGSTTTEPELDFGTVTEGFAQADMETAAKKVTIRNTGTGTLTFKEIKPDHFMADDVTTLEAGASADVKIMPREGTPVGEYHDVIQYETNENVTVTIKANLVVEAAPIVNDPKVSAADGTDKLDFGTVTAGSQPEAKTIALSNSGTGSVNLAVNQNLSNVTAVLSAASLPADGTTVNLTVQPVQFTTPSEYSDVVEILNADTGVKLFELPVTYTVKEAENPSLTVDNSGVDFGSKEVGYTNAPDVASITLTNNGNVTLNDLKVSTEGSSFSVGALSAVSLDAGQTATFNVAPVTGLEVGVYTQTISVTSDKTAALNITVTFTVTESVIKLTAVGKVADITVNSGAEKSADGLKLPATVTIKTNKGKMNASVKWDVKGCAYNVNSTDNQKFSVNGTVVLPEGVTNPDNLSLVIAANVSVGRGAIVSDASSNTITGISSDGAYTTETKITFTAVGAGMDIESPINGDVRYQPLNWEVLETRSWDGAPYSATFRMGKSGSYTLTVTYNQQKFDGSNWVNTGAQDTKQVNFTVSAAPNQTLTPAADKSNANQRNAVQTGDNTPILPFVIILVIAVALIAGILVYRNKKK